MKKVLLVVFMVALFATACVSKSNNVNTDSTATMDSGQVDSFQVNVVTCDTTQVK